VAPILDFRDGPAGAMAQKPIQRLHPAFHPLAQAVSPGNP
jgi:hypothetical protein